MRTLLTLSTALAFAGAASVVMAQEDCPSGTHWDSELQTCIPSEA